MAHLSFAFSAPKRYGGMLAVAAGIFALGFAAGAVVRAGQLQHTASIDTGSAISLDVERPLPAANVNLPRFNAQLAYPAEVIRVIDGDTFEARVRVWPGLDVSTKVRLRNIDAPELHARCADELAKAQASRTALETMLAAGGVTVSRVGHRQVRRPRRCTRRHARHRRRVRGAAQRWLGAQLRRRAPRKLVLIRISDQRQ